MPGFPSAPTGAAGFQAGHARVRVGARCASSSLAREGVPGVHEETKRNDLGPKRDFRGYGATPPHAGWPNNARIAININLNFEAGGERSMMDGDGTSESMLTDTGFPAYP